MRRGACRASSGLRRSPSTCKTGPFRPSTLPRRGPENVVLAGSSVQPGVGVPMVLISGRLAAERITGPVAR